MITTDKIDFLQLQKTGCSHIEKLLIENCEGIQRFGKHHRPPNGYNNFNRLFVGSTRNPWEWYVSYWAYSCEHQGGPYKTSTAKTSIKKSLRDRRSRKYCPVTRIGITEVFNRIKSERSRPYDTWKKLYSNSSDPDLFREWLKLSIDSNRKYDLFRDYGHSSISSYAGIFTYLYSFMYQPEVKVLFNKKLLTNIDLLSEKDRECNILDATIRTENLEKDLIAALKKAGNILSDDLIYKLNNTVKTNVSSRKESLSYYYDDETKELVNEREKLIIKKYSYTFG